MEIWKPIVGYEGRYSVSSEGRVMSHGRMVQGRIGLRRHDERIVNLDTNNKGYRTVWLHSNTVRTRKLVHRLVSQAFIPNPDNKPEVNHVDSDPSNNNVSNLEWCTPRENVHHAISVGRMDNACQENGRSKLTNDDVMNILADYHKNGIHNRTLIGKKYGVSRGMVDLIVTGKNWKPIFEKFMAT